MSKSLRKSRPRGIQLCDDSSARSRIMRSIPQRNTRPELLVRRTLHALGARFRLHRRDLPGSPDIVLPRYKAAILVHGCFWHQHGCKLSNVPRSRTDYWLPKLSRNVERDLEAVAALTSLGWRVLVLWECQLGDGVWLSSRLANFLWGSR
ncbi:very short patch repair endonuclease [Desertibaculum subflavum]|uniref:very short patch repair endonuclease n=1 Tax=Desertibaculum subflavum TaxID=2268458 RepID=UPI0034D31B53